MAKVTPQDLVMDLGSGDGRTVITAAKRGARATGIEYNPDMMKSSILPGIVAVLALLVTSGSSQTPTNQNEQRLLAMVQEIQTQQAQIAANQDKIDSKMAEVTEAVRLARIFAGRGGK